jgi:hypothetical protein
MALMRVGKEQRLYSTTLTPMFLAVPMIMGITLSTW